MPINCSFNPVKYFVIRLIADQTDPKKFGIFSCVSSANRMFVYGSNIAIYLTKKKEYVSEIFCFSANHSTSTSACVAGI